MDTKKSSQGFVPDITNRRDIISRFKDLIDIGPMLVIDWEEEMALFRKKLQEVGWSEENIINMIAIACSISRYVKTLPSIPRNRGDWLRWLENKGRSK